MKTITVPVTTRSVLDKVQCDICGRTTPYEGSWSPDSKGDQSHCVVEMWVGDVWPEGDFRERTAFDICPDCFKDRLMPWMKTQGAMPRIEDAEP